jgi:hypothetical protein
VKKLDLEFEKEKKQHIIHNIFYRYNSKIKRFYEGLEDGEANRLAKLMLKYEKLDFMENNINGLISTYKVSY